MVRGIVTLSALVGSLVLLGADGDYVRFVLDSPSVTPYSTIRYEVIQRGRTTTAVHRRGLPGYDESLHGMGLLTPDEAAQIWRAVRSTNVQELKDAVPDDDERLPAVGVTWRVDVQLDGVRTRFRVHHPAGQRDRRYAKLFRDVQEMVESRAGRHPFRNVFLSKRRRGWLNLVSIPVARVSIDGFETGLETPLYGYEVERGKRKVTLESRDGTYERTYEIRIESGTTTHVRADLR